MDTYNIIIDDVMIDNILKTDSGEFKDLFNVKQCLYFLLLGVLPSYFVLKTNISVNNPQDAMFSRLALLATSILLPIIIMVSLSAHYTSFVRENKILRYYANPAYYIYSTGKYFSHYFKNSSNEFKEIGNDAAIPLTDNNRELIIFVVGETARADHFSLNGYQRKTNPLLEKEDLISFDNVWSCGTSTSVSVPCLFSFHDQKTYENSDAISIENALDVISGTGVNVLWLDNNSDSKNVANRVDFISYKTAKTNPVCDEECRDIGMLSHLQNYIDEHPKGDIFIILHQMGSHGPAYYKRYPKQFEVFKPTCLTNQLEQCTSEEIINAYDNTILYTDYFLSETIQLLKRNKNFESVLFYISDHGESLGENGIYLHGLPYVIAPEAQVHVPMITWFGEKYRANDIDFDSLKLKRHDKLTHDNIFHTILGMLEVESTIYDKHFDIIDHDDVHH